MDEERKPVEEIEFHVVNGCDRFPCIIPSVGFVYLYQLIAKKTYYKCVITKFCIRADKPKVVIYKHSVLAKVVTHPSTMQRILENKCGFSLDRVARTDRVERSRVIAYKTLAVRRLEKAVLINNWGIEENKKVTIEQHMQGVFFLFKFIYVRNLRTKLDNDILMHIGDRDLVEATEQIYNNAKECLKDFSVLLGNKQYLLGTLPTSVDVYLCSYLAPILKIPFPDTRLKNIIKEFPNLVQYVEHFVDTYGFKEVQNEVERPAETDSASNWLIFTAGVVAFATVFTYGAVQGIFRVPN